MPVVFLAQTLTVNMALDQVYRNRLLSKWKILEQKVDWTLRLLVLVVSLTQLKLLGKSLRRIV